MSPIISQPSEPAINIIEAVRSVLSQYAVFSGRARRSEYWWWTLASALLTFAASAIDWGVGTPRFVDFGLLEAISYVVTIVPGLTVATRRLHDTGRSGWRQLFVFLPIIGWVLLFVWFVSDSHPDNEYGPNPKALASPPLAV